MPGREPAHICGNQITPRQMKIDWTDVLTVILGMAIYTVIDRLFLGELIDSIAEPKDHFEQTR